MTTWREEIAAWRAGKRMTDADHKRHTDWPTCAIGEQAALYPDRLTIHPVCWDGDYEESLAELGCCFTDALSRLDFEAAEGLLEQIEDRVLQLKREQVAP